MTRPDWHAPAPLLARYARGGAGPAAAASLEAHLLRCAACRAALDAHVDRPALDAVWLRVRDAVEAPPRSFAHRLLRRLGVPEPDAVVLAAAPALRTSWLLGVLAVLGFAVAAAAWGGIGVFLLVAPLAPVAGVAVSYGPQADPLHELSLSAPYPPVRTLLLRVAAVLATSLPVALLGGLLLPDPAWLAVAWLLPAVAFTLTVLAASRWVEPAATGTGLALAWALLVGGASLRRVPAALVAPPVQPVYLALAVAAAAVLLLTLRTSDRSRRAA